MRTIVAFLLTAIAAAAQTPAEIERLEKRISDHPNNAADRQALLRALTNPQPIPVEKLRAERRAQILWLIEHQPEWNLFEEPFTQLWPRGRIGDAEGFAQAAQLWKELAAKPGAGAKTVANAALFFRAADRAQGFAILEDHPSDPASSRARGILDAAEMLGISGVDDNNFVRFIINGAMRSAPSSKKAFTEVDASKDAHLVGGAGDFLSKNGNIQFLYTVTFGDDDVSTVAERWLRRARELAPPGDEWAIALSSTVRQRAQRTNDAHEKLRLLIEARDLLPEAQKPNLRQDLAVAEFEMNDDAAAERDAQLLADKPRNVFEYNLGQTVLGRLELAHGNTAAAKERLLASVKPPASFKNPNLVPNWTLAQDILDSGDRETVVAFLEASRAVWMFDQGRLDHMLNFVKRAPSPDLQQLYGQVPGSEIRARPAPDFEVKDRGGKTWNREQLTGKVVVLAFGSGPGFEKIEKDFSARGVELFQAAASREDPLARRFEVESDPTLVVIDRKGKVVSYLAGKSNEANWRREIEAGASDKAASQDVLTVPALRGGLIEGNKATVAWESVNNAESYVVEWDTRDDKGWTFDREQTVRVIPTRGTSAVIDLTGFSRIRWRVYAVPRSGLPGEPSPWRESDGTPVTKIYK